MPKGKRDLYDVERVIQQFKTLQRIGELIQKETKGKETFLEILETMGGAISYSSACIFALNPRENKLEEVVKIGRKNDLISFVKFDLGLGFSSWVAKYRKPIFMPNIKRYRESVDNHIHSFMSVPIIISDDLMGVINVSNEEPDSFGKLDLDIIKIIASQISSLLGWQYTRSEIGNRRSRFSDGDSIRKGGRVILSFTGKNS